MPSVESFDVKPVDLFYISVMLMRIPGQHYENVRSPSSTSLLAKEGLVNCYSVLPNICVAFYSNLVLGVTK